MAEGMGELCGSASGPSRKAGYMSMKSVMVRSIDPAALQLVHELRHVFEFQIYRREANVSDFIQFFQPSHDLFANLTRRPLAFSRFLNPFFYGVNDCIKLGGRNWPLFASTQQACHDLVAIE